MCNSSETLCSCALTAVIATGEGGLGGVSVTGALDVISTSEHVIHLATLFEGRVLTSRKIVVKVVDVVEVSGSIVK